MEKTLGILIGLILVVSYVVIRYAYLKRHATTLPKDVEEVHISTLSHYADHKKICTISRKINFFGKIFYMPYVDMVTVDHMDDKNEWGRPFLVFHHKAFKRGILVIQEEEGTTFKTLSNYGYQLKKGDLSK